MAGPRSWDDVIFVAASQPLPGLFPAPGVPAYRGRVDGKLALSIPEAVLNDGKVARVGICGSDSQDDRAHGHILEDRFLEPSGQGERAGSGQA